MIWDRIKGSIRAMIREELKAQEYRQARSIDYGLRMNAIMDSARFVEQNIPLSKRFSSEDLRRQAIQTAPPGMMLEFGVWKGDWITRMSQMAPSLHWYGFDSFEGLPEAWSIRQAGFFALDALPAVPANVTLVKGWFKDTLPKFLDEHSGPLGFSHIDGDLYSSTIEVLDLLAERLQVGTTLVLDDFLVEPGWQREEHRAWFEFLGKNPRIRWEYLGYQPDLFGSVGVRITGV